MSALIIGSTAVLGTSIYAQTDDSELTTFEEEAGITGEEDMANATSTDNSGNETSMDSAGNDSSTGSADDTTIADINQTFSGIVVCDLGTLEVNAPDETTTAAIDPDAPAPTISVSIVPASELETTTSADSTETAAEEVQCFSNAEDSESEGNGTSTSGNTTGSNSMNTTSSTSSANGTSDATATASENTTSSTPEGDVMVIEGQDFAPDQVVLIWVDGNLAAVDEVDTEGGIDAMIVAEESSADVRVVESGTNRSADFMFDGETLTAADDSGEIMAEGSNGADTGGNATDTSLPETTDNGTSTSGNFTSDLLNDSETPESDGNETGTDTSGQ